MVLRARPTQTRLLTNILYTPLDNTHVEHQLGKSCLKKLNKEFVVNGFPNSVSGPVLKGFI